MRNLQACLSLTQQCLRSLAVWRCFVFHEVVASLETSFRALRGAVLRRMQCLLSGFGCIVCTKNLRVYQLFTSAFQPASLQAMILETWDRFFRPASRQNLQRHINSFELLYEAQINRSLARYISTGNGWPGNALITTLPVLFCVASCTIRRRSQNSQLTVRTQHPGNMSPRRVSV
jgi:hypothetical protein